VTDTAAVVKCMKCKATKKVYKSDNLTEAPYCDCGHFIPMMAQKVIVNAKKK